MNRGKSQFNWPPTPDRKFTRYSKNPTIENGLVLNTFPGGNPNRARREDREEGR